jgi:hypothetical protein
MGNFRSGLGVICTLYKFPFAHSSVIFRHNLDLKVHLCN